jgi:hypothetical protein
MTCSSQIFSYKVRGLLAMRGHMALVRAQGKGGRVWRRKAPV